MHYYDVLIDRRSKNLLEGYLYKHTGIIPNGTKVSILFRGKKKYGYILRRVFRPSIPINKIKNIHETHNNKLAASTLLFSKLLSKYYCTSLGETLFSILPVIDIETSYTRHYANLRKRQLIIGRFNDRLAKYLDIVSQKNESTLIFLANYRTLDIVKKYLLETMAVPSIVEISDRLTTKQHRGACNALKNNKIKVTLATRGGIRLHNYPFHNIIVDDPLNYAYFNDRNPAFMLRQAVEILQSVRDFNLYLGQSSIDPESLLQIKHNQALVTKVTREQQLIVKWCATSINKSVNSLTGNIRLIVCPYTSYDTNSSSYSTRNTLDIVNGNKLLLEANTNTELPSERPLTIIATKKVLDYQELIFDETIILGLDRWLSLPGDDNTYKLLDMIWRLATQTKNNIYLQSEKPLPIVEEMLHNGIISSMEKFMQSRHTFKLQPYYRKVDIYSKNPQAIKNTINGDNQIIEKNKISTFIHRNKWPIDNIDNIYQLSNKVTVDSP